MSSASPLSLRPSSPKTPAQSTEHLKAQLEAQRLIDKTALEPPKTALAFIAANLARMPVIEGDINHKDVNDLAGSICALEGDLQKQAIQHFPDLFNLLKTGIPVKNIVHLYVDIAKSKPVSEATSHDANALDLISRHPELYEMATEGSIDFEEINSLAEFICALEGDLQTQAIQHFPDLFDFLRNGIPIADIIGLFTTIASFNPVLKKELTKNLSGVIALLKAGFSLKNFIFSSSQKLRTYVLEHAHQIAVLLKIKTPKKALKVSLSQLLDLEKDTRQEILEHAEQIAVLLKEDSEFSLRKFLDLEKDTRQEVLEHAEQIATLLKEDPEFSLRKFLDLKKDTRQEILEHAEQIIILLRDNIPFKSILKLFSLSIFDLPKTRQAKVQARRQIFENPDRVKFSLKNGLRLGDLLALKQP